MYGAVGLRPELFLATNKRSGTEAQCHSLSTETAVVFKNHPIPVISTDQRERRTPLMQSVMQMFVPRSASRNLSISWMLALPKVTDRPTMSFTYFVANDLIFLERRDSNGHGYKPQRGDISRLRNRPRYTLSQGFLHPINAERDATICGALCVTTLPCKGLSLYAIGK